jgi:hypothetical protein
MKNISIILICGIIGLTGCVISVALAGFGHGTYYAAKCFFPYTMISTGFLKIITFPFIILALVQFPVYGFILVASNNRDWLKSTAAILIIVHIIAVGLAFIVSDSSFSP